MRASSGRRGESAADAAVARGDGRAFATLAERYRRELQLHCYRILGSLEDSEDAVQETFLRAWSRHGSFEGRSTFRTWLYRIATNASLDALARRKRVARHLTVASATAEPSSVESLPNRLLERVAPAEQEPPAELVARETLELTLLAAIQLLPPRQRAVLLLRDVLGWSAAESAALLGTSVAAVNSALQRARATLRRRLPDTRSHWTWFGEPTAEERALLRQYIEASERADAAGLEELLHEEALLALGSASFGELRRLETEANGQFAVAC